MNGLSLSGTLQLQPRIRAIERHPRQVPCQQIVLLRWSESKAARATKTVAYGFPKRKTQVPTLPPPFLFHLASLLLKRQLSKRPHVLVQELAL